MRINLFYSLLISLFLGFQLSATTYQPVLDFEASLSQSGDLINGKKDVTVKIYQNTVSDETVVYEELFKDATFIDGNVRLSIGANENNLIDPSIFNADVSLLSLSIDNELNIILNETSFSESELYSKEINSKS